MTVGELIARLQKYPPHYETQAVVVGMEVDDYVSDFVDVTNCLETKIVNLELDAMPMP